MRRRTTLRRFLLACCTLAGLALADPTEAQPRPGSANDQRPWRVVLIRSWDSLYPVNVVRESAMRDALVENAPRVVEFYPEEMDPLRFPSAMEPELVALLQRKYRDTPMDLVIASGKEPLEFAARHRDTIWPGAAIVFNGVFESSLEGWKRPPRTTGVTVVLDVEGAVALGLALVPKARRLYVVSGTAPFDRFLLDLAMKRLSRVDSTLEVRHIVGLSREETASRVAALEPDSLVLYLTMLRDGSGQISGPGAPTMAQVSASSSVPVLSAIHTQFRRGPVGGSSSRYDLHGRAAGQLARRLLEGADPDVIEVTAAPPPTCEVDWNGLQRWRISEHNVPARCAIVNQPLSPWKTYLWPLAALVAIILLQTALLWSLLMQSRRRRIAEAQLQVRSAELAQAARLAMIGALTASIAHEINQPMGAILSNAEAAEMMLEQGTLEPDKLREILADIRNEDLRASEVIRSLRKLLARGQAREAALEVNTEVAEALRHVAFDAARRGTTLTPLFDSEMPAIMGDAVQLQQVVINLVTNAMEAVAPLSEDRREIRIETRARAQGAEIVVADRGPGLAPEDAAQLFQSNFTTKKDGMGFGLSIVRSIVEMHRGRVWFEPNVPRGAIFRVWLPAIGA